jgi:ERCC4-type nuclease
MSAILIVVDSREPQWAQQLDFGCPSVVAALDAGDYLISCDDGNTLVVERKTPTDFLGTLKENRLFDQCVKLREARAQGFWAYFMITGEFRYSRGGFVNCDGRDTGWDWSAVYGALISIQELGIFVTQCAGDMDFAQAIIRLSNRNRSKEMIIEPKRDPKRLKKGELVISALPGIGEQKTPEIMAQYGNAAAALAGLTDFESQIAGIGSGTKKRIREALGLSNNQSLTIKEN